MQSWKYLKSWELSHCTIIESDFLNRFLVTQEMNLTNDKRDLMIFKSLYATKETKLNDEAT